MYLLFRRSSPYLDGTLPLSFRNFSDNRRSNVTEKTCLLCKLLNNSLRPAIRAQSSLTSASQPNLKPVKKRKPKNKAYLDVIEVTEQKSRFRKTSVTRLKPSDLNLLITSNINLNELYKLKQLNGEDSKFVPHTYSNLTAEGVIIADDALLKTQEVVSSNTSTLNAYIPEVHEESDVESEIDLNMKIKDSLQPEEVEESVDPPTTPVAEKHPFYIQHGNMIAAKTLAAYAEVCNHLRNPYRGLQAFHYHQNKARHSRDNLKLSTIKDVSVYTSLLKGFANKADYQKLCDILKVMEDEQVDLDLNCYTAIFECLGRINVEDHYLKDLRMYVRKALEAGITFDDVMNNGIFLNDERVQVLKALQAYKPSYEPKFQAPKVFYNNNLVNHLNDPKLLSNLSNNTYSDGFLCSIEKMEKLVESQIALEQKGHITIKSIASIGAPSQEVVNYRNALKNLYQKWRECAEKAFQRDLATQTAQRKFLNIEPYLRSVPHKDLMDVIMQEAMKLAEGSETFSPETDLLYKILGNKVYARYRIFRKHKTGVLDKTLLIHHDYCKSYARYRQELDVLPHEEDFTNPRIQWQLLEHERCQNGATLNMGHQAWVPSTITQIGKFLYHIIIHDLQVDVNCMTPNSKHQNWLPAFYTIFRTQSRMVREEIKPHPILAKLYKASQPETLTFPAYEVPMRCPPVPWTSVDNGGYVFTPTDVVRLPSQSSQRKKMCNVDPVQLYPNFDSLNQLASVPWKVNTKLLDVILEVFRNGGSHKLDVPESPSSIPPPPSYTADMNKTHRYEVFKQKLQHKKKKSEMYSLWCDCLYRLSLANHFREDIFWLPHNMDFRGRVYPVPPHLNHLGSDLARSMLVFAEARPLGPEGLDWLKIHLINLTGLKKRDSLRDRLKFANDIMELILDSADKPLMGKQWWAKSDEPWQTLACCMEIANVLRSGEDPALYRSHFPVHQDGSCNGLQHYAALGRDSAGAYSVNLAPCDVPQDVYSAVVALVEEQRAKDEANGLEVAKTLNGFIKRKVIKQTIMTTVYGVTRYGARLQIAKQLKDIDDFPKEAVWTASTYLTGRTFDSLRTMFTSTKEIQDWFTECARLISGTRGSLVEWVTPLGLPVVQPYVKNKKFSMPAGYEGFSLDQFEKPNVMKQKNAFPPNFIHSLDSSHMMLTSLHCARAGITFVSVHDCYWTHPSTIHIMNKICREQFVALHSEPILDDLSVGLYDRYAFDDTNFSDDGSLTDLNKKKLNRVLRKLTKRGDFDISNVLRSVYFFS